MEEIGGAEMAKTTAKRKQAQTSADIERLLERNAWNPFEKVDPKILERLHKKHERNTRKFLLTNFEDAPV